MPSTFTQQVVAEIQELQKLGVIRADGQVEYALKHADDYRNMTVRECADLMIVLHSCEVTK